MVFEQLSVPSPNVISLFRITPQHLDFAGGDIDKLVIGELASYIPAVRCAFYPISTY